MHRSLILGVAAIVALGAACSDETATIPDGPSGSGAGTNASSGAGGMVAGTGGSTVQGTGGSGAAGGSTTTTTTSGTGGSTTTIDDPTVAGPFGIATVDDTVTVPSTGDSVAIHAVYPDVDSGSFPVIVFGHGFQLAPNLYYGYLDRLASHGFVALTVDFGGFPTDHEGWAEELAYGIDWAAANAATSAIADSSTAGAVGHSLGGKLSVVAAANDPRIQAVVGLDPVDGGSAPDASALLPLNIPTAFLGETLDQTPVIGNQACAPAAENYTTFYGPSAAPSIEVTVLGASHMSFHANPNCAVCFLCQGATIDDADVLAFSQAYTTAFFRRHLYGQAGYDTYLTGAEAQMRWVDTGLITLQSK